MAETPMPYEVAIAIGDMQDAARECEEAFKRAAVKVHHFRLALESIPNFEDEQSDERRGGEP